MPVILGLLPVRWYISAAMSSPQSPHPQPMSRIVRGRGRRTKSTTIESSAGLWVGKMFPRPHWGLHLFAEV